MFFKIIMVILLPCSNETLSREEPAPEPALAEKFIELLCQESPESLCDFLQCNQWYRLDEALTVSLSDFKFI